MNSDHLQILWQRRLRERLDDRLASVLAARLRLRFHSLERRERVVARRSLDVPTGRAMLSLSDDGRDTPVLQLMGPAEAARALVELLVGGLETAIDEIEMESRLSRTGQIGRPIWVPYLHGSRSEAFRVIRLGSVELEATEEVHWLPEFGEIEDSRGVAGLGVVVESVAETLGHARLLDYWTSSRSVEHATGTYALIRDPTGQPLLVWEPPLADDSAPVVVAGWLTSVTGSLEPSANFYRELFGWRTEVHRGGPPMAAFWVHGDEMVGALIEARATSRRTVAVAAREAGSLTRRARRLGHEVDSRSLSPLAGREWIVSGDDGLSLNLVSVPERRVVRPLEVWSGLSSQDWIALSDVRAALISAEEVLRGIIVGVSPEVTTEAVAPLENTLSDELLPPAALLLARLAEADQPSLLLEGSSALRSQASGIFDDIQLVVRASGDDRLTRLYQESRDALIAIGVLADDPRARETTLVPS